MELEYGEKLRLPSDAVFDIRFGPQHHRIVASSQGSSEETEVAPANHAKNMTNIRILIPELLTKAL